MNKRIIYFGTNGMPGHYAIPIQGQFSSDEIQYVTEIDGVDLYPLFKDGNRTAFFKYCNYKGFVVPYSPDDNRAGSKTFVLIENGTKEDIIQAIKENKFLEKQFMRVFEQYNYTKEERL